MPCIEKEPIYDMYCIRRRQYQRFLNILFWGCLSGAAGEVLGGVVEVVARGKISILLALVYIYIYFWGVNSRCSARAYVWRKDRVPPRGLTDTFSHFLEGLENLHMRL